MRVASAFFAAVTLAGIAGRESRQESPAPVGCYEFDRAYFRWPDFAVRGTPPPTRVLRLLAAAHSRHPTAEHRVFEVRPVPFEVHPTTAQQYRESSYWIRGDRGTLDVKWSNGPGGDMFHFVMSGDTLRGKHWDLDLFGTKGSEEDASAIRVPCPT